MLFDFINLPYWILLSTGVVLFLFVIISGGGGDDVGADMDADVDADVDTDGELGLAQSLGWLGVGKAPLVLLLATDLSLWGLVGWMVNVAIAGSLDNPPQDFVAGIVLVGSGAIALILGGFISQPIGQAFAAFGEDASSDRLIGCIGTVTSATIPMQNLGKIGQVDVVDAARNLVTVSAILPEWATITVRRGAKVLVIDRQPQGYLVIAKDSPDQDQWLANSSRIIQDS